MRKRERVVVRIDHDELTDHDFESIVLSAKAAPYGVMVRFAIIGNGQVASSMIEICAALTCWPRCVCKQIGDAFARVSE